ncbi:hypothetical protein DYB37_009203 [Aphanomyces astaci]|uniref:Uncharacterized protein n=1 Tax=Aphanomyces astaci TaxID=112090 RepID=A0A3R6ZZN0_APHAT|nr:hypothetical protein DYB35_009184 [Aphanomyces astaci]RHZ14544.1 hypothetical protein DYB37_009203 [Aphanomyces astaci]
MQDLQEQVVFLESVYNAHVASSSLNKRDARLDRLTVSTQFYLHQNNLLLDALRRRTAMNESLLRMMVHVFHTSCIRLTLLLQPRLMDMPSLLYDDQFIQSHLDEPKSTLLTSSDYLCCHIAVPAVDLWLQMWTMYANVQAISKMGKTVTSARLVRLVDLDTFLFEVTMAEQPRVVLLHRFHTGSTFYFARVVCDKAAIGLGHPLVYHMNLLELEDQPRRGDVSVMSKGVVSLDVVGPAHAHAHAVLAQNVFPPRCKRSTIWY